MNTTKEKTLEQVVVWQKKMLLSDGSVRLR